MVPKLFIVASAKGPGGQGTERLLLTIYFLSHLICMICTTVSIKTKTEQRALGAVMAPLVLRPEELGPAGLLGNPAVVLGVLQLPAVFYSA